MADIVACPSCGKSNRVPRVSSGTPRCRACHAWLPWLVEVGEDDFEQAAGTQLPVLVDLWAPWCGPCRMVAPGVERAASELAGRLKVLKVNVDQAPSISARYGVQGIPTLLLLADGRVIGRQVGALPAERLVSWARGVIGASR